MSDANTRQVGGGHYQAKIQHWDMVRICYRGRYFEGQISKYLTRWSRKGTPLQDLEKAGHYLQKLCELVRTEAISPMDQAPSDTALRVFSEFCEANSLGDLEVDILAVLLEYYGEDALLDAQAVLQELVDTAKAEIGKAEK